MLDPGNARRTPYSSETLETIEAIAASILPVSRMRLADTDYALLESPATN